MRCLYKDCPNTRCLTLSFFQIPTDYRRKIWMKHSRLIKDVGKRSVMCEVHFYSKDVIVRGTQKRLKSNTVPISCPTVCKCTETIVDDECLEILNSEKSKVKEKIIVLNALSNMSTMEVDVVNHNQNKLTGGMQLQTKVIPNPPEKTIIEYPPRPPLAQVRTYRYNKKIVHDLPSSVAKVPEIQNNLSEKPKSNNAEKSSELSKCIMSIGDQIRIASDHRKIECLEAVVKYTTQMQSVVKQKGGLDSIIQANSHLVSLVDKIVYEWFLRAQRRIEIGVITDMLFIQKALESKQIFCIQDFDPDQKWLTKLKTKYNITDLDMRLWHIENNSFPSSLDINEIVLHVLERNPIEECFSNTGLENGTISQNENNIEIENIVKIEEIDRPDEDTDREVQPAISNDEQAKLHLKPLEEYVLLKDNIRAIGLISQLKDIFTAEIKKEET